MTRQDAALEIWKALVELWPLLEEDRKEDFFAATSKIGPILEKFEKATYEEGFRDGSGVASMGISKGCRG